MSEPLYAERWLVKDRRPLNIMTRAQAEKRHASRRGYAAILGDPERPSHVVSLTGPWVAVSFFDPDLREHLLYSFKEVRPGEVFLKQAIHREFVPGSDDVNTAIIFAFSEDGSIVMEHHDVAAETIEETAATADPAPNWDRYPEFGSYEHLTREERGLPE